MIFKIKKHNTDFYNTLLNLSRNLYFYNKILLKDTFETRIYLIFIHFSIMLIFSNNRKIKFPQNKYDDLFYCIENNLRELGFGDVGVNKKMKIFNKILYDILLKINEAEKDLIINKKLICKYFPDFNNSKNDKYKLFEQYFLDFYHFCFGLPQETMIKDAFKFKV